MDFIIITGPQAVGKMAVGKVLCEKTGLKLFHNHMTIEMVIPIFPYKSDEAQTLIRAFRKQIFEVMAKSNEKGMVFTYVWAFDRKEDNEYITNLLEMFESHGASTYIVELYSDLEVRLERNKTPLRLKEKPSKQNIQWSEEELKNSMKKYRLNSFEGEIKHSNYLKFDNSHLSEEEAADKIIEHFSLNL